MPSENPTAGLEKFFGGEGRQPGRVLSIPRGQETLWEFQVHLAVTAPFGSDCGKVGNLYRKQRVKLQ